MFNLVRIAPEMQVLWWIEMGVVSRGDAKTRFEIVIGGGGDRSLGPNFYLEDGAGITTFGHEHLGSNYGRSC